MKKWTRIATAVTAVAIALTVGLTSASASTTPSGGPNPPDSGAGVHPTVGSGRPLQPASPRPPASTETTYVAIRPCRIVDTRRAVGQFADGATRSYYVGGSLGFAPQGGQAGGCGIPVGATAVAASIGVTGSRRGGYLTAWPANLSRPSASNVNYAAGQTTASGGNVSIYPSSALALKIYNNGGPTDVFVDLSGYYVPQIAGMIAIDGSVYAGSSRIVSAQYIGTSTSPGIYRVTFDTDVSYCTPQIDTYSGYVYGSAYGFAGNTMLVYTWYLDSTTHRETGYPFFFYITVTC